MANQTSNYNLTKPLDSEFYDVEVQNGNMDKIDTQMKANADAITTLHITSADITAWNAKPTTANVNTAIQNAIGNAIAASY